MRLSLWRSLFSLAVHASARFPRLVPPVVVQWLDDGFYDECMREALRAPMQPAEVEAQRRSWAYGQVAMHDPTITREQVDAIADTIPAPGVGWDCLAGDGPGIGEQEGEEHAAMVDLHGDVAYPSSRVGKEWLA